MSATRYTAKIQTASADLPAALRGFLGSALSAEGIDALLAPCRLPSGVRIMPGLIHSSNEAPDRMERVDPLAPAFPLNGARLVSRLTAKPIGRTVAAVLRPCEIRAFIELVKLRQGSMDELVIIGLDCPGAFGNRDYGRLAGHDGPDLTRRFWDRFLQEGETDIDGTEIAPACRSCDHPVPDGADIRIALFGADPKKEIFALAQTGKGENLLKALNLPEAEPPSGEAVTALLEKRIAHRDKMFAETDQILSNPDQLAAHFAACVNCYNCRVACPVCYCRECVFATDVFNHEPIRYINWAHRKGAVKLPTDTVFYHLTRLAHMSTACVGCGQCTNACPNDIPVMEIFKTVAHRTQAAFDYEAGRSIDEPPPLTVFKEKEFPEVMGIGPIAKPGKEVAS